MKITYKPTEPIKIALLAVGGDGGGVLTGWITKLAEDNGYWAQYTYIAGVAQRTGATVYYIELYPAKNLSKDGKLITPVLSQMPAPQDVDILMATELMEAGRSIQRGFVSKKTTMIFSTNRNLAIREKENAGDGIANGEKIFEMTEKYAKQSLFGNLKVIATKNGSIISSSLFGALAASGTLPFKKEDYIKVIQSGGKGIKQSINSFNEAYQYVKDFIAQPKPYNADLQPAKFEAMPSSVSSSKLNEVIADVKATIPAPVQDIAWYGINHLIDFQNLKYAKQYLEKLKDFIAVDNAEKEYKLSQQVARYLAVGMSYDDLIFVADEKTRKSREKEVYKQVGAKEDEIVNTLDYLHPGFEEITGFMPVKIGKRFAKSKKWRKRYEKYLDKDRRMHSTGFFNFLMLYIMGGMRGWRLKTLRHHEEMENVNSWLKRMKKTAVNNYDLAVELANSYRLKKGYGDTYERGHSKFAMINKFAIANANKPNIEETVSHIISYALQNHNTAETKKLIEELA